jgi:hypothetical protein
MQLTGTLLRGLAGPARVGLSASELTLEVALGVVRAARDLLRRDRPRAGTAVRWAPPTAERPAPPASVVGPAVSIVPPSAGLKQVDDDPVPVAEFGGEGAAESAGAEVRVAAPLDGYDGMTAAQIQAALADADRATVAAVALYEQSRRARRSVMRATDRRLRALSA